MKKGIFILIGIVMCAFQANAQDADTIRIGNIVIIKKSKSDTPKDSTDDQSYIALDISKPKNSKTNWFVFDLGFSNWTDNTNWGSAGVQNATNGIAPGGSEEWLDLRFGKSINFNLWIVEQKINLIDHKVNLKYAVGIESNNYRFKRAVVFNENPYDHLQMSTTSFSKNKLRTDYLTVPVMLNLNFKNKDGRNFGVSAGVSAGYLYAAKQKTISDAHGKNKEKVDFNLNPFKISYIAEVNLGYIQIYGSMAAKSIFKDHLDVTPFNVGFRFSSL